ncbi:MAG: ROK family protein [Actinomycetota bacterium]
MVDRPHLGVGVDVGGTKSLGVLVDEHGEVLAESRVPTPDGAAELLDTIAAVVAELTELAGEVDGIGVGVHGIVDADGRLRYAPNLVGADELPVRDLLAVRFAGPIVVANDTDCAAWAERTLGAAQGHDEAVLVTLGTGIGTGIIADGRIQLGAHGFAGELGHHVVDPAGVLCSCGNRGCWETVASATGLARLAVAAVQRSGRGALSSIIADDPAALRGEHVTKAARDGDEVALAVIDEFVGWVALGLANCVAILDPSLILVGGGLVAEQALLLDPIRSRVDEMIFANGHRPRVRIEPAGLGERAGALGAAVLGRDGADATHAEPRGALR